VFIHVTVTGPCLQPHAVSAHPQTVPSAISIAVTTFQRMRQVWESYYISQCAVVLKLIFFFLMYRISPSAHARSIYRQQRTCDPPSARDRGHICHMEVFLYGISPLRALRSTLLPHQNTDFWFTTYLATVPVSRLHQPEPTEHLTARTMQTGVFWDMTPWDFLDGTDVPEKPSDSASVFTVA
jgi:hypothetical protein